MKKALKQEARGPGGGARQRAGRGRPRAARIPAQVKTHHFGLLRKKVAVLKTIRRERELEQGVAMRESRRADKRLQLSNPFW